MKKVLFAFLFSMAFAFVASASNGFSKTLSSSILKKSNFNLLNPVKELKSKTKNLDQCCGNVDLPIYSGNSVVGTMNATVCAPDCIAFYNLVDSFFH